MQPLPPRPHWERDNATTTKDRLDELSRAIARIELQQQNTLVLLNRLMTRLDTLTRPTAMGHSVFICAASNFIAARDYLETRYRLFSW